MFTENNVNDDIACWGLRCISPDYWRHEIESWVAEVIYTKNNIHMFTLFASASCLSASKFSFWMVGMHYLTWITCSYSFTLSISNYTDEHIDENIWIFIRISLIFVPKGWINNIPALVPIMTWRRPGDKPLSEPMMVGLLMHICDTRIQWVNLNEKNRSPDKLFDRSNFQSVNIGSCNCLSPVW